MTAEGLEIISRKIQNRCALEQPNKTTYVLDKDKKWHIKFWFDSLKLPKYLQSEDEELTNKDRERIANTFTEQATYEYEDDFLIEEFNIDEGWVLVLPDDQGFTLKESVQTKRTPLQEVEHAEDIPIDEPEEDTAEPEQEESLVERQPMVLLYWPTQFLGCGTDTLKNLNKSFYEAGIEFAKKTHADKFKDSQEPIIKIVITNSADCNDFIKVSMLPNFIKTMGIEPDMEPSFLLQGTATYVKDVDTMADKSKSFIITYPGLDYVKDTIQGMAEVEWGEGVTLLKNIYAEEEALIQSMVQPFEEKTMKDYVTFKTDKLFTRLDKEYTEKHAGMAEKEEPAEPTQETAEQPSSEQATEQPSSEQTTPEQPQQESYKKNLLYKVYLREGAITAAQEVTSDTAAATKDAVNSVGVATGHTEHYPEYDKARTWYSSNVGKEGDAKVYSAAIAYLLTKSKNQAEVAEEMAKAQGFLDSIAKDIGTKIKSLGKSTISDAAQWAEDMKTGTVSEKFKAIIPDTNTELEKVSQEGEDAGQIQVTTKTTKLKPESDTSMDKDLGILNIVYTSLFDNSKEVVESIKKVFGVRVDL